MVRNEIDRVFDICLLLVTVIGAAELQYASFAYSQLIPQIPPIADEQLAALMTFNTAEVNFIFRITTIPILILIIVWITVSLFPSVSVKHDVLKKIKKRYLKEFCWTFFGNLFAIEIIVFVVLSFSNKIMDSVIASQWVTCFSFFLTMYATWKYRKADIYEMQKPDKKQVLMSVLEHGFWYIVAYIIIFSIFIWSSNVPTPNPPTP